MPTSKKILAFSFGLFFSGFSYAQIYIDSLDTSESFDTLKMETYHPKAYFIGLHGYYITSAEIIPVQTDLFERLISNEDIPTVELNPGFTLAWMSFMRNWMYTSLSYSYTLSDKEEKDSLVSKLTQYSLAAQFGYNLIKKPKVVVSPYFGLRYTRFKHITTLKDKNVTLDNYMLVRDLDLRVSQFSGAIGINSTFLVSNMWSAGFYVSYLIDFSNNPIIRTKENRMNYKISNPINNFVIGLGFGMGFNEF